MTNDELSAKVAEARGDIIPSCVNHNDDCVACGAAKACDSAQCDNFFSFGAPKKYATCMNAAWELVEEMVKTGRTYVSIDQWADFATVDTHTLRGAYASEDGETAARAICRAYLAFKGVE